MSDSGDQVTKKKQTINNDDHSAGCSKMSNKCAQRLLYETQSTDSNQSTQTSQDIGDIVIGTNNDQNTSKLRHKMRVDNKAAERSRLYRERHREEINQRRRYIRQRQRNINLIHNISNVQSIDETEQSTQATSNNQLSSNSHTQRQQRYYERHKEEINKRKRDRRKKQNISQSIPATAAERNRNYRERKRQEINERRRYSRQRQRKQNAQQIHTECDINNLDTIEQNMKATVNNQQSWNSSNVNIKQEIPLNSISTTQQYDGAQTATAPYHTIKEENREQEHEGFLCNVCNQPVKGFRYACLQCLDFDLCGACETRQAHATHYVLRIPGPRPLVSTAACTLEQCLDVDLCGACEARQAHATHYVLRIPGPRLLVSTAACTLEQCLDVDLCGACEMRQAHATLYVLRIPGPRPLVSTAACTLEQCLDVDLCGACEMRQAHATHYVLRIPGPRPLAEVTQMLRRLRETLSSFLEPHHKPDDGELIKTELKIEAGPDPLKEQPDAHPHASNILEQSMVTLDLVKQECLEAEPEPLETLVPELDDLQDQTLDEEPGSDVSYVVKPVLTAIPPITVDVPVMSGERLPAPHERAQLQTGVEPPPPRLQGTKRKLSLVSDAAPAPAGDEFKYEVFTHSTLPDTEPAPGQTKAVSKTGKGVKKKR